MRLVTPLIIAAYNNQPEVVALLLKLGADIDAADSAGNTALMGASFRGYQPVVQQLLKFAVVCVKLRWRDSYRLSPPLNPATTPARMNATYL